jgi:hypothetical protein
MKNLKQHFLLIFLTLFTQINLLGQINGISGTKLLVPGASTLSKGNFDFEPSLSIFKANRSFNRKGDLNNLSKSEASSSLSFRITLGVLDNLEIGTLFSTGMEEVFIGSKFTTFKKENTAFAIIAGGSLPAGNFSDSESVENYTSKYSYTAGVVVSQNLSDKSSLDGVFSYSKINGSTEFNHLLNYGLSLGYYFNGTFQAIMELNGFTTLNRNFHSKKISVTSGFSYQFSTYLLLVFGIQKDIWGNNELSGTNYLTAFTMCF